MFENKFGRRGQIWLSGSNFDVASNLDVGVESGRLGRIRTSGSNLDAGVELGHQGRSRTSGSNFDVGVTL